MTSNQNSILIAVLILRLCADCRGTNTTDHSAVNVTTTEQMTVTTLEFDNTTTPTISTYTSMLNVTAAILTTADMNSLENTTAIVSGTTTATTLLDTTTLSTQTVTNTTTNNTTDEFPTTETSTEPYQLNVSSIIEMLTNSNETQTLLMTFNLTTDHFFEKAVNYTHDQSSVNREAFFNSSEGQLLLEMIRANASVPLGRYASDLQSEVEQVFFYALLIDVQNNLDDKSYVDNIVLAVVFDNSSSTYSLNASRLSAQICLIYINAGGQANACRSTTTATPYSSPTNPTQIPVAIVVGCTIGGVVLLVLIILIAWYICSKTPASKVTPSDSMAEYSRPNSKNNGFCNESNVSVNRLSDSGL